MSILVIDDSAPQRLALASILSEAGYTDLLTAGSAIEAFQRLRDDNPAQIELILTDLHMPDLDGIEVCRQVKAMPLLADIPLIMITSSGEMGDLTLAFTAGAMDYITKPANEVELLARVRSALKLKQEMDSRKARERELRQLNQKLTQVLNQLDDQNHMLQTEQAKSERLLLNILPQPIAERLKQTDQIIADQFDEATVLFADIVNFTSWSACLPPQAVVSVLNEVFSRFDQLAEKHGLEKIKTIGDAYMAVAGVPMPRPDHAQAVAAMALDMRAAITSVADGQLQVRIGIHSGPVVAGVIGQKKFIYDLWGDTVNVASRMESHGLPGSIQVTAAAYSQLKDSFTFGERGLIHVKGRGEMVTYWLMEAKDQPLPISSPDWLPRRLEDAAVLA
jgi:adenylate cyclase